MADQSTAAPVNSAAPAPEVDSSIESSENQEQNAVESSPSPAEAAKLAKLEAKPESKLTKSEKKMLSSLKLKVDGKVFDEKLPFEIPEDAAEYMTRELQLSKAAQNRIREHGDLQKQINAFITDLRKDPKKILSDPNIGIDLKQLAASVIEEEIERSKKSPEQLEKEKLEQRLRDIEAERAKEKEEIQKQQFELLQSQAYDEYDKQITSAIEGSKLPKSPYIVKKVADYMLMGLQEGLDIKAADVLPLVEEEMHSDLKQMFEVLPEDVIEKLVGKDTISKLRKKNVAKAKAVIAAPNTQVKDVGVVPKKESGKPAKKMTFREYLRV